MYTLLEAHSENPANKKIADLRHRVSLATVDVIFIGILSYFIGFVETSNKCFVIPSKNVPQEAASAESTDVTYRFRLLLILLLVSCCVDFVYELMEIASVFFESLKGIAKILRFNEVLQVALVIMVHIFRM
jgi:hypothetical protein